MSESIEKIKKAITSMVLDFTTLEVTTIKGEITINNGPTIAPADATTSLSSLLLELKVTSIAKAKVIAGTIQEADGDMVSYLDENITDSEKSAHAELLKSAQESRTETIKMLAAVAGLSK